MKVFVDKERCISCGACVGACSNLFRFDDDGYAERTDQEIPEEKEDDVLDLIKFCPGKAIKKED